MGLIALEGMRFFAYHGVYEEEQQTGNQFIVDVYIDTSLDAIGDSDDVSKTINYETVFLICESVMRQPVQLIETLLYQIMDGLKHQFNNIHNVKVRVRKLNPMPGERVDSSYVEDEANFISTCPRCQSPFVCYQDGNCWCQQKQVHPATLESLQQQYGGCLCSNCLDFFAG